VKRGNFHLLDPREERGVAAVMVALCLFVVFGMTVLVVDLGALIVKHRSLVNANDAAALAAAGSFARNKGDTASTQADHFARENVADAEHDADWWTVSGGLPGSICDPASCGSVKVKFVSGQALFFAPVLGLTDHVTARGTATAIWGPAGGGHPVPIPIRYDWLNDKCSAPLPNSNPPTECAFFLQGSGGEEDEGGNGQWAWVNLNAWNTGSARHHCPNLRRSDLKSWIAGGGPDVAVNSPPAPTFVCTGGPDPVSLLGELQDLAEGGKLAQFPVNDASGQFAPPGQVDEDGNRCPPDSDCKPNQDDIVGFTVLRIDDAIRGSEDGRPGDPHVLCEPPLLHDFDPDPPNNTWDLDSQVQCSLNGLHNPDDHPELFPRIRKEHGNHRFKGGLAPDCQDVDYCYDSLNHVITWLAKQPEQNARVDWLYVTPPTPGRCGFHDPDPDAVCLVVSWHGYQPMGINPGRGMDFGLRAVRLSE
jgi:putative Flp pilus-assembly TadE/G-like protein